MGFNYSRDGDLLRRTVDIFVVQGSFIGVKQVQGLAATYTAGRIGGAMAGAPNTIYLVPFAVGGADNSHIPSHEMGHVLLNAGNEAHVLPDTTNLMHPRIVPEPSVNATKRLTGPQHTQSRTATTGATDSVLKQQ